MRAVNVLLFCFCLHCAEGSLSYSPTKFFVPGKRATDPWIPKSNATPKRSSRVSQPAPLSQSSPPTTLFHVSQPQHIYSFCSLSATTTAAYLTASCGQQGDTSGLLDTYAINSPKSLWEVQGVDYMESSNGAIVAGAISAESEMWGYQTNLTVWNALTGAVIWMKYLKYVEVVDIAVSPDGTTVTGLFWNGNTIVYDWDVASGDQLGSWTNTNDGDGRALVAANNVFAVIDEGTLVIIEKATGNMLWNDTFDFSTSTVCMSSDGSYVAYGFENIELYAQQTNSYSQVWSVATTGPSALYFAGACSIESGFIGVGWYSESFNQNQAVLMTTSSSTPVYTYTYPPTNDTCQDLPVASAMTLDGKLFVMGSWGDCSLSVPQTNVFSTASTSGAPVYTLTSPGSIFDVDILTVGNSVYAASCGKNEHANDFGDGGDLYSIQLQ